MATTPAIKSAIGPAKIIPSIPPMSGSIRINGNRKIICLVNERNIPLVGLPMEEKKLELIGCKKFQKVKKK